MTDLVETAAAKVNLSLRVQGRRPDGYHEIESLVAFASAGDRLSLAPGPEHSLTVAGCFAEAIDSENLVVRAVRGAMSEARLRGADLRAGTMHLVKRLPVAAGLGGGSADAAAALRLLMRHNPDHVGSVDWNGLAAGLGADVPVCLGSRAALMTGTGTEVAPLPRLPAIAILLANPGVPLSTAKVFAALGAAPLDRPASRPAPPHFRDTRDLLEALGAAGNDLEPVARRLCPPVGPMLERLAALPGAGLARMSGSGPTCFALFATLEEAERAGRRLAGDEPGCWTAAATLT